MKNTIIFRFLYLPKPNHTHTSLLSELLTKIEIDHLYYSVCKNQPIYLSLIILLHIIVKLYNYCYLAT